jgi:hypothetical protein
MYNYFETLEKMIQRQVHALQKLSDIETEMSLHYQKEG